MAAPTVQLKGLSYLAWGTNSILGTPATAICESISITPVNSGPLAEIEDGDGFTKGLVLADNGFNAAVSIVVDRGAATPSTDYPILGETLTLTIEEVYWKTTVGTADGVGTNAYTVTVVAAPALEYPRKGAVTIKLALAYRPLV